MTLEKFIINFDPQTVRRANVDTPTLGGSIPVSAPPLIANTHSYKQELPEVNPYAVFLTLALPTNGWGNRVRKHDPSIEEQEKYFHSSFKKLFKLSSFKKSFNFFYSLEYNSDFANIHAHGVIHQYSSTDLIKFKKQIRIIFKIISSNRIAIKYYKSHPQYALEKYQYHLLNIDYNLQPKNKVKLEYYQLKINHQIEGVPPEVKETT